MMMNNARYFFSILTFAIFNFQFAILSSAFAETREFTLTVTDGEIELNGVRFTVWRYNGMFPGPEIRVKEGDRVKVKLRNMSGAKHGLFFHGLHVGPKVSLQEQMVFVDPGYEYTYGEFIATPAGTHLYHCSWNMAEHLSRGMYGAFIVEGRDEPGFDKEFVYILSDWNSKAAKGEGHHEMGHPRTIMDYDITTINNQVVGDNPIIIDVKMGERVRIRMANIGFLPHKISFPEGFIVTHEDGYPISEPKRQDSLTIYPGKRHDMVITLDRPGQWPFYHSVNISSSFTESLQNGHKGHDYSKPIKGDVILILDVKGKEEKGQ